jgi:hypothetical protein
MTERLIAYCGLICNECPAYLATQANDRAELERVAAMWREEFNEPSITAESILCDGCTVAGRKSGYCGQCQIRPCAMARKVANCAHCEEYGRQGGCEKLETFLGYAPEARTVLDDIYVGLMM